MPETFTGVIKNYKENFKANMTRLNLDTENVEIKNFEYWYLQGKDPFSALTEDEPLKSESDLEANQKDLEISYVLLNWIWA